MNLKSSKEKSKIISEYLEYNMSDKDIRKSYINGVNDSVKKFEKQIDGLIQFHENRIEELIKDLKRFADKPCDESIVMIWIKIEYESINAIELWLEDMI